MPVKEQAPMGMTELKAYSRRRKAKKEGPSENTSVLQDQLANRLKMGHSTTEDDPANRLLSLELDVAEALADFWRMVHLPSQQHEGLRWSCKRKRTAAVLNKDSMVPSIQPKDEPEDALSAVKKNRSACVVGRDSSTSDRDEIESTRCSKESSSLFESRAQSPSSPLPSLQLPSGPFLTYGSPNVKSAFQRVVPLTSCLVTVKTELEDMDSDRLVMEHQQVSVRPKARVCKSMASKAAVKMESWGGLSAACVEVKSEAAENHKVAGTVSLNKTKCALSEKEKEARRLRRVQANRESARQTIRKKQVLCDDLTKKASSLALENESMKQKRDALLRELFSLKGQNHHLKWQLEMRSSGNLGHDSIEAPPKLSSDSASIPALQAPRLPYAGVPPPAFVWAMAAAAAAANQAHTLNKQEIYDPHFYLQHQNGALVLPSLPSCKQALELEAIEQVMNRACSGNSSPSLTDLPQKVRDASVRVPAESAIESQCDDLSRKAAHTAMEYAGGDSSRKSSGDFSKQAGVCVVPQPTSAGKPELTPLPDAAATVKSMDSFGAPQMAQGAAYGFSNGDQGVGFYKQNPQVQAMKGYAAMVAAEARRRRKELTRNKFARGRGMRPAAVR